jgi:uncharacterized protein (UPF0332 family)
MKFDNKYFAPLNFSSEQAESHLKNAKKDINIARTDGILDVKFNYAYTALIKAGIALLCHYKVRVKSMPGHHIKIIEAMAEALNDDRIAPMGDAMRAKRNVGMYSGGAEVTEKECKEYIAFVEKVINRVESVITAQ